MNSADPQEQAATRAIVVIGAGAAGLWAAQRAANLLREQRREVDVLLLEKTPRAGTKVLASGGTRCNLTTTLGPKAAAALFGRRGERFLQTAFRALPPEAVREQFAAWGVPTIEAPLEKIFPESGNARHVRDALLSACQESGVELRCGIAVQRVAPKDGRWHIECANEERITAQRLLLCPGGKSYPATGTTGDGYRWLEELGFELEPTVPALVPLISPETWVHELTGLSVQDAIVRLRDETGKVLGERARPILFTHLGLSGPAVMDLSHFVARAANGSRHTIEIDLLPSQTRETLTEKLRSAASQFGSPPVTKLFTDQLPRRLLQAVCQSAGLPPDLRANSLPRAGRHALVEALKGFRIPISTTAGFDKAEVTAGGLALDELDPGTMRTHRHDDLFVLGEVIDLAGPIGGLNFQAAFATAELAARAVTEPG